jgi:putative salt-induced outer membrane protein
LKWRHLLNGRIDFQQSDGKTTADRWKFGWQPNYKANEILFVYGLGQYERDRFLGFHDRYTLSSGIGLGVLSTPAVKLSIQGGPAVRYTNYVDSHSKVTGAGRASLAFQWRVSPTFNMSQDAAIYLENGNNNAVATTSLETRLIGDLKARLSYDVQYEEGGDNIADRKPLDTTSRATLVYSF